jgi:hypothetical protein
MGWARCVDAMPEIDRFRPGDRRGIDALSRRTQGPDAVEAARLRWDWQHQNNPANPSGNPALWVAREGPTIIGCYSALPLHLSIRGLDLNGVWGTDPVVAPERERQGLDEALVRACDRNHGAVLALGVSEESQRLLTRLRWPSPRPVPLLVKPLTRRAFRLPNLPAAINGLISAVTLPLVRIVARTRPLRAECEPIAHFDETFTRLWDELARKFDLAVRRDAAYLNWRYIAPPHVRYSVVALRRNGELRGYAVYRHRQEPLGRATILVDFLVDPTDVSGLKTLLRWVDRAALANDADKIRCYVLHSGFRRVLRRNGYFGTRSSLEISVKLNALKVPSDFHDDTSQWHVTYGDAARDR